MYATMIYFMYEFGKWGKKCDIEDVGGVKNITDKTMMAIWAGNMKPRHA